jgi:hypothetical protein
VARRQNLPEMMRTTTAVKWLRSRWPVRRAAAARCACIHVFHVHHADFAVGILSLCFVLILFCLPFCLSQARSTFSIHSKFRAFAKSRESQSLSPALRRLQIALSVVVSFVLIASITAYFLVNARIDEYTIALNNIQIAGARRVEPITFAFMILNMSLAHWGFADKAIIQPLKDTLLPLRIRFEQTDNDLYLFDSAHKLVHLPVAALNRLSFATLLMNMNISMFPPCFAIAGSLAPRSASFVRGPSRSVVHLSEWRVLASDEEHVGLDAAHPVSHHHCHRH